MQKALWVLLLLPLTLAGLTVFAEEAADEREVEEARRQQAFRDGMTEIVEDLNNGSFVRLTRAIDERDMFERIFGLRLIDQRVKRDFRDSLRDDFRDFIAAAYEDESEEGVRARLLVVESRGVRGRAVVRFDLPHLQANYIEYDLRLDDDERVVIVDWTDYLKGHRFTDRVGLSLVQVQPGSNAVRKLIGNPSVSGRHVFQVVEVLKAARDSDFERFFEIYSGLDDSLKGVRAVLTVGLDASRDARKRRNQRKMLAAVAEYYPDDPLYSLSLLDYYFPTRQYDKALGALVRLRDKLGVEDAVFDARLSSTKLVMNEPGEALVLAERAVAAEPDHELGWWSLLRAEVALEKHPEAIAVIERLQNEFDHSLGPEALAKDPTLRYFAQTAEYRDWVAASGESDAAGGGAAD